MSHPEKPTVTVRGHAEISLRPSHLIQFGRVEAVGETLEIALVRCQQKREAVVQWLQRMGVEQIEFGQPRFPDQVEPNAHLSTRRHLQLVGMMGKMAGVEPEPNVNHRSVVYVYGAFWSIEGMSPEEILILADRIRFESDDEFGADEGDPEDSSFLPADSSFQFHDMLEQMRAEPEEDKTYQVFLTRINQAQRQGLFEEAWRDARGSAALLAESMGKTAGELDNLNIFIDPLNDEMSKNYFRENAAPLLSEAPFKLRGGEVISECPKNMDFQLKLMATFQVQ